MKNFRIGYFAMLCISILLLFVSCKKDKETTPEVETPAQPSYYSYAIGKWNVGDNSGRVATNNSDYLSFEFTVSGDYLIAFKNGDFVSGEYELDSLNNKIVLTGFGEIIIDKLEVSIFDFRVIKSSAPVETVIHSEKVIATFNATSRQDSLCRNWTLIKKYVNDNEITAITDVLASGEMRAELLFSENGTYFTKQIATGQETIYENSTWEWVDGSQTSICIGKVGGICNSTLLTFFVNGDLHYTITEDNTDVSEYVYSYIP